MRAAKNKLTPLKIAIVLAAIFSVGALAFGPTGFFFASAGGNYNANIAQSEGGSASSPDYKAEIYSDAVQGEAESSGYSAFVGAQDFFAEESGPAISNISQSTSTPAVGEPVEISASIISDASLVSATLFSNESGVMKGVEAKQISGTEADVSFTWSKPAAAGTSVAWKISAADIAENSAETNAFYFFVGATDLEPPTISSPKNYPEEPAQGQQIIFSADISDDFGLASATLEVSGENVSTIKIAGKTGKAEFTYISNAPAGKFISWKIFARDSSKKESVSEEKIFKVAVAFNPVSKFPAGSLECNKSEKPETLQLPCVDGKRKDYEVICNGATGKWDVRPRDLPCLQINLGGGKSVDVFPIVVGFLIVILALLVYFYKKNPEVFKDLLGKIQEAFAPKKEEKPEPPAEKEQPAQKEQPPAKEEKKKEKPWKKKEIPRLKY